MPSRGPQRLEFIDWARGLAIITVLLFHSSMVVLTNTMRWQGYWWDPSALPPVVSILNVLLQWLQTPSMFFVISGYLVHRSMARHAGQGALTLLLRRGLRLYAPYLVVLVFYGVVWSRTRLEATTEGVVDGVAHLLLIHNFSRETIWSINGSFWYVAIELQLCALYPLVMAATRRFGWNRTMLALLVIELGTRAIGSIVEAQTVRGDLVDSLLMRWPGAFGLTWYLGAWIAELQRTGGLQRPGAGLTLGLPAAGFLTVLCWPLSGFAPSVMGMVYAAWLAWWLCRKAPAAHAANNAAPPPGRNSPSNSSQPLISRLGSLTLGIYLLNQPVIRELSWRIAPWVDGPAEHIFVTATAAITLLLPAAWLMAWLVEKPLVRLVDSWLESHSRRHVPRAKPKVIARA